MTSTKAAKLAKDIERDDPACRVTGFRRTCSGTNGRTRVEVEVLDTRTGYPFVVFNREDWQLRKAAAEAPIV